MHDQNSRKSIVIERFMLQKTVIKSLFTESCSQNVLIMEGLMCFHCMNCFSSHIPCGNPMFTSFVNIFKLKYASLYTSLLSSENFTRFTLLFHQTSVQANCNVFKLLLFWIGTKRQFLWDLMRSFRYGLKQFSSVGTIFSVTLKVTF